jgi:hypothetical protein
VVFEVFQIVDTLKVNRLAIYLKNEGSICFCAVFKLISSNIKVILFLERVQVYLQKPINACNFITKLERVQNPPTDGCLLKYGYAAFSFAAYT